jgi:hypothetical protein
MEFSNKIFLSSSNENNTCFGDCMKTLCGVKNIHRQVQYRLYKR